MKFVGVIDRERSMTIDGYSNCRTQLGAIREMGRLIASMGYEDGDFIVKYGKEALCPNSMDPDTYCLEVEEVPCACVWHEDTDEMEYAEGRWYVMCRFVK